MRVKENIRIIGIRNIYKKERHKRVSGMIDLKQLKYFTVSADVASFSEAAKILYTTQSNVSKAIAALEKSLGVKLFHREARGISLTVQGKNIYQYANRILEDVNELENFSNTVEAEWISVSTNPSSWFARRFMEFYNLHYEEDLHFRIQTTTLGDILNRVRDCKDELGFVYVLGNNRVSFEYELKKHHLEYEELAKTNMILYLGAKHPYHGRSDIGQEELNQLRYIQNYQDEFAKFKRWALKNGAEHTLSELDVAVVTNSDYIMEMMLTESRLANISGSYLSEDGSPAIKRGIPLEQEEKSISYGYVKRQGEKLGKGAQEFVSYIRRSLASDQTAVTE